MAEPGYQLARAGLIMGGKPDALGPFPGACGDGVKSIHRLMAEEFIIPGEHSSLVSYFYINKVSGRSITLLFNHLPATLDEDKFFVNTIARRCHDFIKPRRDNRHSAAGVFLLYVYYPGRYYCSKKSKRQQSSKIKRYYLK
jgi:hypothetical protein